MRLIRASALVAILGCGATAPRPAPAPAPPLAVGPADLIGDRAIRPDAAAVVLVLDRSGSMQGGKLEAAKAAMVAALAATPDGAFFGVVVFDSQATVAIPAGPIVDRAGLAAKIGTIDAGGGTNLPPGLELAYDQATIVGGPRVVVLLSDGQTPTDGLAALLARLQAAAVVVSTVAIGDADVALLQQISDDTGGRTYQVTDLATLPTIYAREVALALSSTSGQKSPAATTP